MRFQSGHHRNRIGMLKVEALIAAVVVVVAMNFVSIAVHRINRLWDQTRQYQFAINELSNQLESLVDLSEKEARKTLGNLKPSDACEEVLGTPRFLTAIDNDELGTRITLTLAWQEIQPNAPQLSAWLADSSSTDSSETGESK